MTSLKARPSALTLDHVSKLHMDGPRQVAALDDVSCASNRMNLLPSWDHQELEKQLC